MNIERLEFESAGERLVGDLFWPDGDPVACAVITGPSTSVKEQASGTYARALAARGFLALAFDHRYFGESTGRPRQFENPHAKAEDVRAAVVALKHGPRSGGLPFVAVGVCAGGGYMASAVAQEPAFAAFAGVAGYYAEATPDSIAAARSQIERGRAAESKWYATGHADTIPAVAPDGGDVAMPLREAYEFYGTARGAHPNYVNHYAVQSFAYTIPFDAVGAAAKIRVPTLVVHSDKALAPSLARKFIAGLGGPREELWLRSTGQIDFYDDPNLIGAAADAIARYFRANQAR
jgi:fermentation-respiration switch protein FrsA (DUF1100 family)